MALPSSKITIKPDGTSVIEGLEQSDQCHNLSDLGKRAGKVTEDQMKEHPPVHQTVNRK